MQYKLTLFICSTLSLIASSAMANTNERSFIAGKISTGMSLGVLNGETKEFVYESSDGSKNSQLDWKYNNAAVVKGSIDWDIVRWLSVGASGWTTLASNGGNKMDDYDWLVDGQKQWSDHSWHPNTRLNYANAFDLNVNGWILNQPNYRLGLQTGYQENRFSFTAIGGYHNYDNGADIGTFANKLGIGYQQHFKIPYVGLIGNYRYKNLEAGGKFRYSGWVHSSDTDQHYMANKTFNASIHNQDYYALSANLGYYLTNNAKAYIESNWSHISNKKGKLTQNDRSENSITHYTNASGISNKNFMTSIGLMYTF